MDNDNYNDDDHHIHITHAPYYDSEPSGYHALSYMGKSLFTNNPDVGYLFDNGNGNNNNNNKAADMYKYS